MALLRKDERWLIIISADPDALASAMALKRIMARRVAMVGIAHVNEISRPDNLAMIHHLRIPTHRLTPNVAAQFDRFALVDSQPHHHPDFGAYHFSIVIDHHPPHPVYKCNAEYQDIRHEYGATATLFTEYLYQLKIRPGKLLATALLYGIKADTQSFERHFSDVDFRAFRYLSRMSNHLLMRKVVRSEYHLGWLKYFSQAFKSYKIVGNGLAVFMCQVDFPDILVILADFFLHVQEISWVIVCGQCRDNLVAIFRGDGLKRDMGKYAMRLFGDYGTAGGHKSAARAEIPLPKIEGTDPRQFVMARIRGENKKDAKALEKRRKRKLPACPAPDATPGARLPAVIPAQAPAKSTATARKSGNPPAQSPDQKTGQTPE